MWNWKNRRGQMVMFTAESLAIGTGCSHSFEGPSFQSNLFLLLNYLKAKSHLYGEDCEAHQILSKKADSFSECQCKSSKMWLIKTFFKSCPCTKHIQHTDGIAALQVIWDQLGNVHFTTFWFQHKKSGEAFRVNSAYSDTDSETQQLWPPFGKGK